jgi:hypothetical protein
MVCDIVYDEHLPHHAGRTKLNKNNMFYVLFFLVLLFFSVFFLSLLFLILSFSFSFLFYIFIVVLKNVYVVEMYF